VEESDQAPGRILVLDLSSLLITWLLWRDSPLLPEASAQPI